MYSNYRKCELTETTKTEKNSEVQKKKDPSVHLLTLIFTKGVKNNKVAERKHALLQTCLDQHLGLAWHVTCGYYLD